MRGNRAVLSDVHFHVARGEAVILRGPNGGGKTTLLRSLAGLGHSSSPLPESMAAYAGHSDGLKPQLTVRENYRFWSALYGTRNINQTLETFDLQALADRRAADLSAGQKRRSGLGRLLLSAKPIWLLDEPTVSLDTANVARFAAVLKAHLAGGGSALIATHIDLGLSHARSLDITDFTAKTSVDTEANPFAEAIE